MNDLMIDIETMGTDPGSVITQIGAIPFDRETGEMGEPFCINVDMVTSVDIGLNIDPKTVYWWFKQSEEARTFLNDPKGVFDAYNEFSAYIEALGGKKLTVWSHTFDMELLELAYKLADMKLPIHYRNKRDLRTLCDLAGITKKNIGIAIDNMKGEGVKHDAIFDCKVQIEYAVEAFRRLRMEK